MDVSSLTKTLEKAFTPRQSEVIARVIIESVENPPDEATIIKALEEVLTPRQSEVLARVIVENLGNC